MERCTARPLPQLLDVGWNTLRGTLPTSLLSSYNLVSLQLNNNPFEGGCWGERAC
jgi:hypothetical protein